MQPAARAAIVAQAKASVLAQGVARVMPESAGQFNPSLPYVTYEVLPGDVDLSFGAAIQNRNITVRFHSFAQTTADASASTKADAIAAALENGLHNFSSTAVKAVLLDTPTFDGPSEAEDVAHRITDFLVLS